MVRLYSDSLLFIPSLFFKKNNMTSGAQGRVCPKEAKEMVQAWGVSLAAGAKVAGGAL